ncbi:MAG: hypothetical protein N2255_11005, partial [Kiritimatiellae bacterium]|nr:hypothetical protein [Kiritimatiellia bacterium]
QMCIRDSLSRLPPSAPQVPESVSAIAHHTQRGIALVTRLLEISQPPVCRKETSNPVSAVKRAVTSLCDNLPLGWQVEDRGIESLPPIGLTEEEIEQIVTHLGLLVADHMNSPGCIIVRASQSDSVPPGGARPPFAGVLAVHAREGNETTVRSERLVPLGKEDAGAVESVLRSMIEEAGGRLDRLLTPSGQPVFQVWLPSSSSGPRTPDNGNVSPELLACVANWLVFTALERNGPTADLVSRLRQMGVRVEEFKDLLSLVSRLEEGPEPDAILLDVRLSGNETTGLVRAVMRLKPTAGIVLLGDNNNSTQWAMGSDVRSISEDVGLTCVITTLIEAKTLAAHRLRQLPRSEDFLSRPQHALKGT